MQFDIIHQIMSDACKSEGIASVLQRLVDIATEQASKQPCLICGNAAWDLAVALDNAKLQFTAAIDAHALTEAVIRSSRYV